MGWKMFFICLLAALILPIGAMFAGVLFWKRRPVPRPPDKASRITSV
jgi:uncharacterized protein YpmS